MNERRSAELTAALSLAMIVVCSVAAACMAVLETVGVSRTLLPTVVLAIAGYAIVYGLARSGAGVAASWTTVVVQVVTPLTLVLTLRFEEVMRLESGAWVALAILTANAVLGLRAVVLTSIGAASLLGITWLAAGAAPNVVAGPLLFLLAVTTIVVFYARHRDWMEDDRQRELAERSAEHARATGPRAHQRARG